MPQLTEPLLRSLQAAPQRTATVAGPRRRSHAELADRVARLAGGLQRLGVRKRDRIAVLAANSDELVALFHAAWWLGAVIVPFNTRWHADELAFAIADCGCRVLLAGQPFWAALPAALRQGEGGCHVVAIDGAGAGTLDELACAAPVADAGAGGDDLAAVFYTGGTTGRPKGVMLSHDNLALNARAVLATDERDSPSVGLLSAPLFHVGGASLMLQLAARHSTMVCLPAFEPAAVLRLIEAERIGEVFFVPTMLALLLDAPQWAQHDLSSLRNLIYGAAPMDDALLHRARAALPQVRFSQAYGMTEASPVVTLLDEAMHRAGWPAGTRAPAGRPLAGLALRIFDGEGRPLPAGEVGEIVVRGPTVMQGYWNRPEATAEALRGGWLHTGDAGRLDAAGLLQVVDRIKDMVITGGENVYSVEVENAVLELPGVAACAVVGVPHALWGEAVHAAVVLRPGAALAAEEVIAHCRTRLAGFKCPRTVAFHAQLPLSAAGKVLKHEVRAQAGGGGLR